MIEKQGRKLLDGRMVILLSGQLLVGVLVLVALLLINRGKNGGAISQMEFYREIGGKLQTAGVIPEAIEAYEKYLNSNDLDKELRAKIFFSLGNLYEESGAYEKALHKYYAVQVIDSSSESAQDSSKRIVALLERLKKYNAAKFELKNQTALEKENVRQGGDIVAKIEGRPVFKYEINEELDQLPEMYKKQFEGVEGKKQFLQKYVADELLLAKARKLQYQNDAKIRKQLDRIEKQLLVQRILEDEIQSKISADPADIKNFYEANKSSYNRPEQAEVELVKISEKDSASQFVQEFKKGKNFKELVKSYAKDQKEELEAVTIVKGTPFLTKDNSVSDLILKTTEGKLAGPTLVNGVYYLFKVNKKIKEVIPQYEQIEKQVVQDYKMQKSQNLYSKLLEDILKTDDVKLFMDKM